MPSPGYTLKVVYEPDNLLEDPAFTGNDNTVIIKAPLDQALLEWRQL